MGFIESAFNEVKEEVLAPVDTMHDMRIVQVERGLESKGEGKTGIKFPMVRCMIRVEGPEDYEPIFHYIVYPTPELKEQDAEVWRMMARGVLRFCTLFGVKAEEDLDGATARGFVVHEEREDGSLVAQVKIPRMGKE